MDRALGFDWLAGYRFVHAHPWLASLLGLAYASLMLQGLYFCLLHGLMRRKQRLREMFWLFLACGGLACLGAALVPALGPSKFYAIQVHDGFMPEMLRRLSGEKHFRAGDDERRGQFSVLPHQHGAGLCLGLSPVRAGRLGDRRAQSGDAGSACRSSAATIWWT